MANGKDGAGLIVDYIGIFDDVARALDFDEKAVQLVDASSGSGAILPLVSSLQDCAGEGRSFAY
jgi:hypothetical protein